MTIANPDHRGRSWRDLVRTFSLIAAAAAGLSGIAVVHASADAGAGTTIEAGRTGPGGWLDQWCTEQGGGMSSNPDGTETCNL
ncbi:hypothetical protein ACFQFC_11520 [Amorphoplanes digitatis]|uniref:Uncharacterized protein n=1 Tax=Actinoplanes digitatis TaxID=1868 RepID=A0A7W7I1Q7_9ACTN|nr:hypothetical protein [Actinoplanes digitatis]MBB4764832.1 hypothetical protein [Actinoplanes digitatis]BFE74411.1 hypothetical protein GCM10020092_077120 [Actinoplanes digitatis]GID91214.1 hypothetical protein Adi01nite_06260 [Actinoplanes digitatis]